MRTIKTVDLVNDFKRVSDWLEENVREWVTVSRPHNRNLILMTEQEANDLMKSRRNLEYLLSLEQSIKEAEQGEVVMYTKEQMDAMAKDL